MCISFDASLVAISGSTFAEAAHAGMSVSQCAPEPAHNRHLKIASFNFGYDQAMMDGVKNIIGDRVLSECAARSFKI